MALTDVQICNAALLRCGQAQPIAALTDATAPARACNALYDLAVESVLGRAPWKFATARSTLTLLEDSTRNGWDFVYLTPSDMVAARYLYGGATEPHPGVRVPYTLEAGEAGEGTGVALYFDAMTVAFTEGAQMITESASGDILSVVMLTATSGYLVLDNVVGSISDNELVADDEGASATVNGTITTTPVGLVLLTDLEDAELIYTKLVDDAALFPIAFVEALTWKLAVDLALGLSKKPQVAISFERKYMQALAEAAQTELSQEILKAVPDSDLITSR